MSKGIFSGRNWMIGALAAIAVGVSAMTCTLNGGLSVTAGHVEITMNLTPDGGLAIRFINVARS